MASIQQAQPRIGRDVAATRKSRSRNWPVQSTLYERIESLVEYSAAIDGQVQGIGKGMTAGRDFLAYFLDKDNTPRLKYSIQCEHGRSKKQWPQYPHPSRTIIPVGTSLEEICQLYPLHCWADGLRIFMAENWTAEKIYNLLPEDARNTGAVTRPWNYLQQAMGREADKMYEEDDNGPRVILKRKRDDGEGDEEVGSDTVQTPPEKRQRLIPRSNIVLPPQTQPYPVAVAHQQIVNMGLRQMVAAPNMSGIPRQVMSMTRQQFIAAQHMRFTQLQKMNRAPTNTIAAKMAFIPQNIGTINPQHLSNIPRMNSVAQRNIAMPKVSVPSGQPVAQSNMSTQPQRLDTFKDTSVIGSQGFDWSGSAYKPAEMIQAQNLQSDDLDSYELHMLHELAQTGVDHNGGMHASQDHTAAVTEKPIVDAQKFFDHEVNQNHDSFREETIVPSMENDTDECFQSNDAIEDDEITSEADDDLCSGEEHSDDADSGDESGSEYTDGDSEDEEDSEYELSDEAFNFNDEDQLKRSDRPMLVAEEDEASDADETEDIITALMQVESEDDTTAMLEAVYGLSEGPKLQCMVQTQSAVNDHQSYFDDFPVDVLTPESLFSTSDSSLSPDAGSFCDSIYSAGSSPATTLQPQGVVKSQMYQNAIPSQRMATQYAQPNNMSYTTPMQSHGMMRNSMYSFDPQPEHAQEQAFMMQGQGYGTVKPSQMRKFPPTPSPMYDEELSAFDQEFSNTNIPEFPRFDPCEGYDDWLLN